MNWSQQVRGFRMVAKDLAEPEHRLEQALHTDHLIALTEVEPPLADVDPLAMVLPGKTELHDTRRPDPRTQATAPSAPTATPRSAPPHAKRSPATGAPDRINANTPSATLSAEQSMGHGPHASAKTPWPSSLTKEEPNGQHSTCPTETLVISPHRTEASEPSTPKISLQAPQPAPHHRFDRLGNEPIALGPAPEPVRKPTRHPSPATASAHQMETSEHPKPGLKPVASNPPDSANPQHEATRPPSPGMGLLDVLVDELFPLEQTETPHPRLVPEAAESPLSPPLPAQDRSDTRLPRNMGIGACREQASHAAVPTPLQNGNSPLPWPQPGTGSEARSQDPFFTDPATNPRQPHSQAGASNGPGTRQSNDPHDLANLVNQVLADQARRSGVDLS